MNVERVLVGIDDEAASETALDWVIDRAATRVLQVKLFTAFDELVSDPVADDDRLHALAERFRASAPGSDIEIELVDRAILEGLAERSADADLLVIGSHPHRRVRSILTGALPSALISRSACPVVIVPDDWKPGGDRVVLGVSDDDSSDTAIRFAAREARVCDLPLDAVHAWRLPVPSMDAVTTLVIGPDEIDAIHRKLLERVVDELDDDADGVEVRGVLRHGDPAVQIESALDHARILVLGTHGHGPAVGALLGSTVQHLLHRGRVPIAVVPRHAVLLTGDAQRPASVRG